MDIYQAGVLIAVPENVLDEASLQEHSQVPDGGTEPLVCPYKHFSAPLLVTGDGGLLEQTGELCGATVIDMSRPGVDELLSPYSEEIADVDLNNNF